MTAKVKDHPPLWGFGTTKTFKIPIEHLDFKYIENCSDVKQLEKILCVLRSGEEGYYPELTEFCEKRLTGLAPRSRALRKDKPAATASSFSAEEWEKIDSDLKSWVSEIKREENTRHFHDPEKHPGVEDPLPPVRGSNSCPRGGKETSSKSKTAKKRIPRDYAEWDKFDVEKECSKIDEDYKEKTVINNKAHLSKIETKIDTAGLTEKEKNFLANREKGKGNEAFYSGDYEEAVMYYTRSLSALPTATAYNNRAQAEIKLQRWSSALEDCEKALELEPGNIKALLRRATTYKHQNKFLEAVDDLRKVLQAEPDNDLAKKTLSEVERELKNSEPASELQTKGKRMVIEEVENSGDEGGKGDGDDHEDDGVDMAAMGNIQKKLMVRSQGGRRSRRARTPMPGAEQQEGQPETGTASTSDNHDLEERRAADSPSDLKSRGNELFRGGQFAEAAVQYSGAIAQLEPTGSENADELSILYSNRAACYLKEGNCRGCIQDCDRALELQPFAVKPLLRRAMAYETLEQYRSAYVDYITVLKIDCRIQLASDSVNRITRILTELDGPKWRERLPPIPAVPASEPLRVWHPAAETPDQDPCPNSCTPSITDEKMFQALKEEGNQLVKDKNYKDAISKYNECLKINSKACAIYTNRALCYLKLGQFEEAKLDCDKALQIDSKNVKASYRLELAQKGLEVLFHIEIRVTECSSVGKNVTGCGGLKENGLYRSMGRCGLCWRKCVTSRWTLSFKHSNQNCRERVADPSQVVLLSPDSSEAARHLDTKNDTAPPSRERERRRIEIQEVDDSSDEEPERPAEASAVEEGWSAERAGKIEVCKPRNAYEFGQVLSTISARKDEEACAQLLVFTAPQDLPVLLSNKLEGDMLLLIMQSLKSHLVAKDPSLVCKHLLYLSKAERFEMMLALTSKDQKEQMAQLFDDLSDAQADCLTAEDIQALRRQYVL